MFTDLPLDDTLEVETDTSVGNKVETSIARKQRISKRNLFEPNGVDCANTAVVGDWKRRSTKATQATINSVSVKEEPTIPKDVFVSNTEGTSYENVICIDDPDDNKADSAQPS
eukprot:6563362-Ditylum_brightwellii.AAC.1